MSRFKFGDMVDHVAFGVGVVIKDYNALIGGLPLWDVAYPTMRIASADADLTPYTPPAPAGTVPVRIAVAVNNKGDDFVCSTRGVYDKVDAVDEEATRWIDGPVRVSFITAHVPLPQPPAEVAGVVEGTEKC